MRQASGQLPIRAVAGSDSLYKYALPIRSNRLRSYFDSSPNVLRSSVIRVYDPGTYIFRINSAPSWVWLVLSGDARLIFPSNGVVRSVSRLTSPGELIGLSETIAGIAYGATLKAESECRCLSRSREELVAILLKDRILQEELLVTLSEGLNEASILARADL